MVGTLIVLTEVVLNLPRLLQVYSISKTGGKETTGEI